MLRLTLPNGSLEPFSLKLFEEADLPVRRTADRDYNAAINDPRFAKVKFLRPQEIPEAIAGGHYDLGLCETHSIREARADVVEVMDLGPGGRAGGTTRIVLAVPSDKGYQTPHDLPAGVRVSTEFPAIAADYFSERGIDARIRFSHGATEAKIPELADAIVELTETGSSLRRAGFAIIDELIVSSLKLIANRDAWDDAPRREAMGAITTLLNGVLQARGKVLLKMNVPAARLDALIAILPAMKAPTVSRLFNTDYYAVESVAVKSSVNLLIPELKRVGAEDILEIPISKIVA
ncbi:MAG: ATP phosphoribosyltransferase [Chloroflexota bacterium]|nr:MAG: ATP phosphoribosyltransferase [Chloroflexota bacterium]